MAFDTLEKPGLWARFRLYIIAAVALAVGLYAWQRSTRPLPVAVVEAKAGPAERVLAITGRTRPQVTVTIVPKVAGQIVRLTKEEGQTVRAGELLVQLDADAPRAAADEAAQQVAVKERAVTEARRNYERAAQLKERGLATIKDYDEARFTLDQAQLELQRVAAGRREVTARLAADQHPHVIGVDEVGLGHLDVDHHLAAGRVDHLAGAGRGAAADRRDLDVEPGPGGRDPRGDRGPR